MDEPTTTSAECSPASSTATSRRRRWWRWAALGLTLVVVFHVPLLRTLGRALTVNPPTGAFNAVVILGGDHRLEVVKQLMDAGRVETIWMIEGRPSYLVTAGILPSPAQVAEAELLDAGISPERLVTFYDEEVVSIADIARVVASRMREAPDARVLLVCETLSGRHVRIIYDDVLGDEIASRVAILGLPDDNFDVDTWWRSRTGLKELFGQICQLGFTMAAGTDRREPPEIVDPEEIEQTMSRRFGGSACYAD